MNKKNLLINIFILVATFLILFAVAEIIVKASGIMNPPFKDNCDIHMLVDDQNIVYKLKPNATGLCTGVDVKVNSHGLRDYEYKIEKDKDVFRIAVIGDSMTFGKGVKFEDTFAKQLEGMLNKGSNKKYDVLNFGVYGYNTLQERHTLEQYALNFSPDLVIIVYILNDPQDIINIYSEIPYIPVISELRPWLNNLYFYRYAARNYANVKGRLKGSPPYEKIMEYGYDDSTIEWQRTEDNLQAIYNTTRREGIPALLVIFPKIYELDNYPFTELHEKVEITAREQGFYVLDLFPYFEGLDERELWVDAFEDHHANKKGHLIAAKAIYEELVKKGLAEQKRPDHN